MTYQSIKVKKEEGIAWIIFDRPHMMNALDSEGVDEFSRALDDAENDENVKVVILTGSGRAFCAGGDFNFFLKVRARGEQAVEDFIRQVHKVALKIVNLKKFVIASVNGDAMGGGCSFALAADIIIASEKARFGLTFVKIGLVPDTGATYLLPRLVGPLKAKELFVTGDMINAAEAFQIKMVNKVVPADQLEQVTLALGQKLADNPPMAMGRLKTLVNRALVTDDLETVLDYETKAQIGCLQSEEFNNLIQAFFKKRETCPEEKK